MNVFFFAVFYHLSDAKFKVIATNFQEKYTFLILAFMQKHKKAPLKNYAASKMSKNAFFLTLIANILKLGGDRHIW